MQESSLKSMPFILELLIFNSIPFILPPSSFRLSFSCVDNAAAGVLITLSPPGMSSDPRVSAILKQ